MGAQGSKAGSYLEGNCARANEALAVYAAASAAAHCALVWMTSAPSRFWVESRDWLCVSACLHPAEEGSPSLARHQTASTLGCAHAARLPALCSVAELLTWLMKAAHSWADTFCYNTEQCTFDHLPLARPLRAHQYR